MSRRGGFTLIELLVVIAIIGILAAMLFPVFARARESARKIQCLSNVENVAMAMQMYFTDYDRFPPGEHDPSVIAYWQTRGCDPGCCSPQANPYLRWAVIFDEYVKNRDVYRCPSAKSPSYPQMIMDPARGTNGYWLDAFKKGDYCACVEIWPKGWGGTATDTSRSNDHCGTAGASTNATEFDIYPNENGGHQDKPLSTVNDVAKFLAVAERGVKAFYWRPEQIAYPDLCRIMWGAVVDRSGCSDTCSENDGVCSIYYTKINQFWTDASYRARFARHLGGANLGFLDGHAKWMQSEEIMRGFGNRFHAATLEGLSCQRLPKSLTSY